SHSERFAPLWVVADALVDHLATTYDVAVDDSPSVAADYVVAVPAVVRAVRVTPAAATAAPLPIALTPLRWYVAHDGLLHAPSVAADYVVAVPAVVRAVRVTPAAATAAPLTFALTPFPGVVVHAGLLHDTSFPGCGCDACDETWQGAAEDLEELVSAVVGGRF